MGLDNSGLKFFTTLAKAGKKSTPATLPVKNRAAALKLAPQLSEDTLCISSKINEAKNFLLHTDLNQYIKESLSIGTGGEAALYRIDGTDFLLRVHHDTSGKKVTTLDLSDGIDFNTTPKDRVNNIIGKFKGGEIVKYIKGEVVQTTKDEDVFRGINDISDSSIKEYLKKIFEAEAQGLYHDNYGANALFDKTSESFTPIDFWENESDGILSSVMDQCHSPCINKEKLIKKVIRVLLEMVKKGEVSAKQLNLSLNRNWLDDGAFASEIENICKSFEKDPSEGNIDTLLKRLEQLNEFSPDKIKNLAAELNEAERKLSETLKLSGDDQYKKYRISYYKDKIERLATTIKWQEAECL